MMIRMEIMVKILMVLITILGSRLIKLNKMMSPLLILLISPAKHQTDNQTITMKVDQVKHDDVNTSDQRYGDLGKILSVKILMVNLSLSSSR